MDQDARKRRPVADRGRRRPLLCDSRAWRDPGAHAVRRRGVAVEPFEDQSPDRSAEDRGLTRLRRDCDYRIRQLQEHVGGRPYGTSVAIPTTSTPAEVAFDPTGQRIAIGTFGGTLQVHTRAGELLERHDGAKRFYESPPTARCLNPLSRSRSPKTEAGGGSPTAIGLCASMPRERSSRRFRRRRSIAM